MTGHGPGMPDPAEVVLLTCSCAVCAALAADLGRPGTPMQATVTRALWAAIAGRNRRSLSLAATHRLITLAHTRGPVGGAGPWPLHPRTGRQATP